MLTKFIILSSTIIVGAGWGYFASASASASADSRSVTTATVTVTPNHTHSNHSHSTIPVHPPSLPAPLQYQLDKSWPHKSVSELKYFGSSIVLDGDGDIVLLHRGTKNKVQNQNQNRVAVIDAKSGTILREWGSKSNPFPSTHGVALSKSGDIFITDTVMHQVLKFDFDNSTKLWSSKPSLVLGQAYGPGGPYDRNPNRLCGPSDVLEEPESGEIFVADGYCHSRVLKYDRNGTFLKQFEAPIPTGSFNVTHAIALAKRVSHSHGNSSANATGGSTDALLLVADANNGRIQCFNRGEFLYEIGAEWFGDKSKVMSIATASKRRGMNESFEFGQLYVIATAEHLAGQSKIFIFGLSATDARLLSSFSFSDHNSSSSKNEEHPHDIAVSPGGKDIYVVEAKEGLGLKRFVLGGGEQQQQQQSPPHKDEGSKGKGGGGSGAGILKTKKTIHLFAMLITLSLFRHL